MQITKIYSMWWADAANTFIGLIADTDTGTSQTIGTPYNDTSIIWSYVKDFPKSDIKSYVEPVIEVTSQEILPA